MLEHLATSAKATEQSVRCARQAEILWEQCTRDAPLTAPSWGPGFADQVLLGLPSDALVYVGTAP